MEPPQKIDEVVLTGLWVLFSLLLALCASCLLCSLLYFVLLLWSLRRSAPLVLFGGLTLDYFPQNKCQYTYFLNSKLPYERKSIRIL